jgi:hypothetical protein
MKLALALIPALAGLSVADDVVSLLLYGVDRDSAPEFEVTLLGSVWPTSLFILAAGRGETDWLTLDIKGQNRD